MKTLISGLFLSVLFLSAQCCFQKDYKKNLPQYQVAAEVLKANKDSFLKYENEFNNSDSEFVFLAGKEEFLKIMNEKRIKI
jgi:uncharacterized protein YacL (UPF0231 family)